jgi:hypothetical protein
VLSSGITTIKKKGPVVTDRALEVWERMPERHTRYADVYVMLQARSVSIQLTFLQLGVGKKKQAMSQEPSLRNECPKGANFIAGSKPRIRERVLRRRTSMKAVVEVRRRQRNPGNCLLEPWENHADGVWCR